MPTRRLFAASTVATIALLAAACGSDEDAADEPTTAVSEPAPSTSGVTTTALTTTVVETTELTTTEVTTTVIPTSSEAPTTTAAPDTTAAPTTVEETTTVAPTTVPAGPSTDVVVVTGAFGALGIWDGPAGLWNDDIEYDAATVPVAPGDTFTIFGLNGVEGSATATGVELMCETVGTHGPILDPAIGYEFDLDRGLTNLLATTASFDIQPRAPEVLDPASPEWVPHVQERLVELGIPDAPVNVVQAVQADLDGNGSMEVVIVAENPTITDGMQAWDIGSYALVLVLRPDGGEVLSSMLESYVVQEEAVFPNTQFFELSSIADLNGDGTMEVLIDYIVWEGAGTDVFEVIEGIDAERVLSGGCGS